MQTVGKNIKYYRKKAHLSQEELASRLQLSTKAISSWEIDRTEPNTQRLKELCTILNCTTDELIYGASHNSYIEIPLYDEISCGTGGFVLDETKETIAVPCNLIKENKSYFAQYAKGDSMIDEHIIENDLLIFELTSTLDNGEIGCFVIDENIATCKKYYKDDSQNLVILQPANSEYTPIVVTSKTYFKILGRLHSIIRNY